MLHFLSIMSRIVLRNGHAHFNTISQIIARSVTNRKGDIDIVFQGVGIVSMNFVKLSGLALLFVAMHRLMRHSNPQIFCLKLLLE